MKYSEEYPYHVFALCVAKFHATDSVDFIKAFQQECLKRNCRVVIFSTLTDFFIDGPNHKAEEDIFEIMDPLKFDAVVILSDSFKKEGIAESIAKRVTALKVPCISINKEMKDCINILQDYSNAFEEIVRHIVEDHKFTKINFIAGNKGNEFSEARLGVYKKVLTENNIPVEESRIGYGDFWEMPTAKVVERFVASRKEIEAIICANDIMAMETCRVLALYGINVPADIAVTGFDGAEIEKSHFPRITTAEQDVITACKTVIDCVESLMSGDKVETSYKIPCKFRKSQSCGCIKMSYKEDMLYKMGREFFSGRKKEREFLSYVENFYEKISSYGNLDNLSMVWPELGYVIGLFNGEDTYVSLNTDFLNDEMKIWPNIRPMTSGEVHFGYTDDVQLAMHFNGNFFENGTSYKREELIPAIGEQFDTGNVIMLLPLYCQGSTIGYLTQTFNAFKLDYAEAYSFTMNIREIIEMHKYRIDQQNLYSQDQLTKLLNRKGFYRHMEDTFQNAIRDKKQFSIISMDMNWLKQTNDTYGHKEGDFALAFIGELMERVVGSRGVCTRFGGDEFAIGLVAEDAEAVSVEIISEIKKQIENFNAKKVKPYPLSVSSGYYVKVPTQKDDIEKYIVQADRDMYRDKMKFKETHTWEESQVS